jgi:hypothetical protein
MSEIIQFQPRKRKTSHGDCPIIEKIVDGKIIECVNVDDLTQIQRSKYFSQGVDRTAATSTLRQFVVTKPQS